jgi:hypothetical protein
MQRETIILLQGPTEGMNTRAMSVWTMERHRALHYKNHLTLFTLFTRSNLCTEFDLGGEHITLTLKEHVIPVLTLKLQQCIDCINGRVMEMDRMLHCNLRFNIKVKQIALVFVNWASVTTPKACPFANQLL